ncbi:membrane protein [Streptomyces avidinii]
MTKLLLSLHVLAAVLTVGPVAVAASMFSKALRLAQSAPGDPGDPGDPGAPGDHEALATLRTLHRICRVYAAIGIAVPLFGFATAGSLGVLGSGWLITSIALTAGAGATLAFLILPAQERALGAAQAAASAPGPGPDAGPGPGPGPDPGGGSGPGLGPDAGPGAHSAARLAMLTGVFNLLWATVTVLMIIRPGSTTGA